MMVHQYLVVFRRRGIRPTINSIKHVVDTEGVLTGAAQSLNPICVAVPNVSATTFKPGDVRVGGVVNAFFISLYIIGATGAPLVGSLNWYLIKLHAGQSGPAPGNTGVSQLRNQIIHEEKGLSGSGDGTAMVFKGVIVVPRGMRRMRDGDTWELRILSNDASSDGQFCLKAIFKSFF